MKIPQRFEFFCSIIDLNLPLWDIGCDHGKLGELALKKGVVHAHFVDSAEHLISHLKHRIRLRYKNASFYPTKAQYLNSEISGSIIMAGFGGDQMLEILSIWLELNQIKKSRWVLSPHKDEGKLKDFLISLSDIYNFEVKSYTEKKRTRPVFVLDHIPQS